MTVVANVVRQSALLGMADWRATQTWWSWIFGWLLRLLMQMAFFGMAAGMFGSAESLRYVLIGNAVAVVILETSVSSLAAGADRSYGTVTLLAAAPVRLLFVYLGRSIMVVGTSCLTVLIALGVFPWLLGAGVPLPRVLVALPIVLAIALTCYCYGVFLASVLLRRTALTWLLINIGYFMIFTFGGVNVPLSLWPDWLRTITHVMPLRHGLEAVRACIDGAALADVLPLVGAELLVGAGWLGLAWLSFEWLIGRGRRGGNLEFTE